MVRWFIFCCLIEILFISLAHAKNPKPTPGPRSLDSDDTRILEQVKTLPAKDYGCEPFASDFQRGAQEAIQEYSILPSLYLALRPHTEKDGQLPKGARLSCNAPLTGKPGTGSALSCCLMGAQAALKVTIEHFKQKPVRDIEKRGACAEEFYVAWEEGFLTEITCIATDWDVKPFTACYNAGMFAGLSRLTPDFLVAKLGDIHPAKTPRHCSSRDQKNKGLHDSHPIGPKDTSPPVPGATQAK